MTAEKEILSVLEAARFLGVSERSLRRLIAEKQVPFARVGGSLRLRRTALVDWLAASERQAGTVLSTGSREKDGQPGEGPATSLAEGDRQARVRAVAGKYADLPFSSEDLVREKQREKEQEAERWFAQEVTPG